MHGVAPSRIEHGPDARPHARAALDAGPSDFVIGTVGNFTKKKDHATMLRAFADVAARHETARLVMIGSGPLFDETRALAAELGLASRVDFLGKRDDVDRLLPGLDLFILSSRYEGLPIALLEAMSAGVACVATRVGGIPEVLRHEQSGLLVDAGDPEGLAAALTRMGDDDVERRRLGARGAVDAAACDLSVAVQRQQHAYQLVLAS